MAHVGFLTLKDRGHLYPMSSLAHALTARGHRVTFFSLPDAEPFLKQAGIACRVICAKEFPLGYAKRMSETLSGMNGLSGVRFSIKSACDEARAQFAELPAALKEAGVDALVLDQLHTTGSTVAEHLGLPFVHVAISLLINFNPKLPPGIFNWPNKSGIIPGIKNRVGYWFFNLMLKPVFTLVNEQRRTWGLQPFRSGQNDSLNAGPQLTQQPPSFEFPRNDLPSNFHFVGPLSSPQYRASVDFPWDRLDGRPLIYATMGTMLNNMDWILKAILESVAGLNAQLVLTLGGDKDPAEFEKLAPHALIVKFAPQLELLSRASLCICHAGLNTVLEAFHAGVPVIGIPITNDQPGTAARIAWTGTGECVAPAKLTAQSLREKIVQVMADPSYVQKARAMQTEIASLDTLNTACRVVESVLPGR